MGWTSDLLVGVAQQLALSPAAGVWTAPGAIAGETVQGAAPAITLITLPAIPERVICLTDYLLGEDDPSLTEVVVGLQVRIRGTRNPMDSSDIRDAVYDRLQGLAGVVLNGVVVAHIFRDSGTPLGPDSAGRYERSENYRIHANRPGAHRDE